MTAAEPKSQDPAGLLHATLDLPGRTVIGRKIIRGGNNGRVVYKYVKVSRPQEGVSLDEHLQGLSLAEAKQTASQGAGSGTRVAVYSEADAMAYMAAKAEARQLDAAVAGADAAAAATAAAAAAPASSGSEIPVNNLASAPAGSASGSVIQATVTAGPAPPPAKPSGFAAFWTDPLEFTQTAAALLFLSAVLIGMALGATVKSYMNAKEAIEAVTKKYQAYTVD